jgi:hypothetical protein
MTSLFLSKCKVTTKPITIVLCMALGHLPSYAQCWHQILLYGNSYMITKSKIDASNLGLFILSHVFIPPKQSITLMSFCSPLYSQSNYLNILKYKHSISICSMCMKGYASEKFNRKKFLCIEG